jgi:hypothetical protein
MMQVTLLITAKGLFCLCIFAYIPYLGNTVTTVDDSTRTSNTDGEVRIRCKFDDVSQRGCGPNSVEVMRKWITSGQAAFVVTQTQ